MRNLGCVPPAIQPERYERVGLSASIGLSHHLSALDAKHFNLRSRLSSPSVEELLDDVAVQSGPPVGKRRRRNTANTRAQQQAYVNLLFLFLSPCHYIANIQVIYIFGLQGAASSGRNGNDCEAQRPQPS